MTAIQDAVEAEFPAVANCYCDRLGRLCVHGRYARFDPVLTAAETAGWDFRDWKAGDGAAVARSPTDTAHIRSFSTSRDLGKIINFAMASPKPADDETDPPLSGQIVTDADSKRDYGIRSWSAQGLLTKEGVTDGDIGDGGDWLQTKRFAQYYVDNYKTPRDRVTQIGFRSSDLAATGSGANWEFLTACDLNDRVTLTIGSPGGGGYEDVAYFIEGIHEQVRPAGREHGRRDDDARPVAGRLLRREPVRGALVSPLQQKPILHGRDHCPGGADPIPCMISGPSGDFETASCSPPGPTPTGGWARPASPWADTSGRRLAADLTERARRVALTAGRDRGAARGPGRRGARAQLRRHSRRTAGAGPALGRRQGLQLRVVGPDDASAVWVKVKASATTRRGLILGNSTGISSAGRLSDGWGLQVIYPAQRPLQPRPDRASASRSCTRRQPAASSPMTGTSSSAPTTGPRSGCTRTATWSDTTADTSGVDPAARAASRSATAPSTDGTPSPGCTARLDEAAVWDGAL